MTGRQVISYVCVGINLICLIVAVQRAEMAYVAFCLFGIFINVLAVGLNGRE